MDHARSNHHRGDHVMDQTMRVIPTVGEVGLDTEASPGNGSFYVRLYDGSYDMCGFDTIEEAYEDLVDIASNRQYN
jgi:hypothetical protein